MVQKSGDKTHRLDGAKTLKQNGISYQPQLVFPQDF